MVTVYLRDILDPKRNNFTSLRLLAALAVLIDHAVFLRSGLKSDQIFAGSSLYTLGDHAVSVFFVLSGLTVAGSFDRSRDAIKFLIARALRIFPALIVCSGLLVLLGFIVSECGPGHYLADTRVAKYLLKTISLSSGAAELPGLFANNPHPLVVNASLWTLKYEAICYVLLAVLGLLGLLGKPGMLRLLPATWALAAGFLMYRYGGHPDAFESLARFWLCFSFGAGLYVFHDRIKISFAMVIALAALEWLVLGAALERVIAPIAIGYAAIWFGSLSVSKLREFCNRNDFSYGVYIFGWPISQTLVFATPQIGLLPLIGFSTVLAIGVAVLSWHFVEKPSLALRDPCASYLRRHFAIVRGHLLRLQAGSPS